MHVMRQTEELLCTCTNGSGGIIQVTYKWSALLFCTHIPKLYFTTGVEISEMLCLPLTDKEMLCVSDYLTDNADLDRLVIHLLQIGEIASAVQLNKKLNTQPLVR